VVAGTAAVVLVVGSGTAGALALYRRPLPVATVATTLGGTVQVPGVPPVMPWPSVGQGAIAVPALGVAEQSGPEQPVPVASLTKITVAAVVLRDHPLAAGASGPAITVTEADAATYGADAHDDQSTVPVRAGEVLTEEQMIDALLLASANNLATALARWDAGSQGAFVTRMNALAASLGMSSTHYADASGFDPHTVSSAADVLKVTAYAMSEPAFADAVAMRSVTVPVAGTIHNIVSEVTSGSAIGVKSGYTSEAGGCLVLARRVAIGSTPVLVLAAVVGQPVPPPVPPTTTSTTAPPPPPTTTTTTTMPPPVPPTTTPPAGAPTGGSAVPPPTTTTSTTVPPPPPPPPTTTTSTTFPYIADPMEFTRPPADHLLDAVAGGVRPVRVAVARRVVGQVDVRWSGARHRAPVATTVTAVLAGWPGLVVTQRVDVRPVRPGDRAGTGAGSVTYQLGAEHVRVPLELAAAAPAPDLWWRISH
jgi:hypothetical protein